jgi:glycosyltransferase involved in cell wall biosynthesis
VKGLDVLVCAWPSVVTRIPDARLVVVGAGRLGRETGRLRSALPRSVEWASDLAPSEVARLLDDGTLLVLPSRSEGLPRVIIEAFSRGRPVVASAVGGIPDMVVSDVNGILVPPGDEHALTEALTRVLGDPPMAARLADGAFASAKRFQLTADEYALSLRELVDRALSGS